MMLFEPFECFASVVWAPQTLNHCLGSIVPGQEVDKKRTDLGLYQLHKNCC
jgi:hypothetical protein